MVFFCCCVFPSSIWTMNSASVNMPEESWQDIEAQVAEQIKALQFIDRFGAYCYHKVNQTKRRNLRDIKYVPLQGVSATNLWESADAAFEMEQRKVK